MIFDYIFKNNEQKILKHLELIQTNHKYYPAQWQPQTMNFVKVQLNYYDAEYQEIQKLFQKSDKGRIHEIHRIQNRALWDNYITEKTKLIQMYQNQGIKLTNQEESRYLWHGVKNQHPNVIYSGLKEAFDQSFSQVGSWGAGIYFAENANYSRGYSYNLFQNYNRFSNGKLVFLCCLVTTGKVERQNQSQNIKRPSDGYDCVSSMDSSIFILYSMDIRRAYPAYEVVFE